MENIQQPTFNAQRPSDGMRQWGSIVCARSPKFLNRPISESPTLTRPSATLSHRMGEGRGEGFENFCSRRTAIVFLRSLCFLLFITVCFSSVAEMPVLQ
ncbi:MAG TPA: hypothetical protein VL096_11450, partial [Pirellulaceae bacterium]|nr:hypothetical protein [Pirellulaceae bacterium]